MSTKQIETKKENEATDIIHIDESADIFHLLDSEDEQQIILEAQDRLKQALVYQVPWQNPDTKQWEKKDELSYAGINHLILLMSQKGQAVEIVSDELELKTIEYTLNDKLIKEPRWFAKVVVRNLKTGMETVGVSETAVVTKRNKKDPTGYNAKDNAGNYIKEDAYDDFARPKSMGKALRNAWKLQLPQKLILEVIRMAREKGQTKTVDPKNVLQKNCTCPKEAQIPSASKTSCMNCGGKLS